MKKRLMRMGLLVILGWLIAVAGVSASGFVPGHFYAPNPDGTMIYEYDQAGVRTGLLVPRLGYDDSYRGVAFGPDNLLYITVATRMKYQYKVIAVDATGAIQRTYSGDGYMSGYEGHGKIAFDKSGHFYVASLPGIARFDIADTASFGMFWTGAYSKDVMVLPNGNVLTTSGHQLFEISADGQTVWMVDSIPYQQGPDGAWDSIRLGTVHALEYDALNDDIFVYAQGYTGMEDQILKVKRSTLTLVDHTQFPDVLDMYLTPQRQLVVGNFRGASAIYSTDLQQLGLFDRAGQKFVTQFNPVPEPSSLLTLGAGILGLIGLSRRCRSRS